ncbi:hypothetical protein ACFU67_01265 [Streptomyces rhizosphaericola]|uniref:hypothetical protein n=1 Tax=Streptomyces rhizosphaericola TaxID=2564098 RepID=UPI0036C0BE3D
MTVVLSEQWGGCETSDAVAELLFRSRALAAEECSTKVLGGHLVRAVREALSGPRSSSLCSLRDALETVGVSYEAPPPPTSTPTPVPIPTGDQGHTSRPVVPDPPVPGDELRALLGTLGAWASLTGDTRATSLHLLAALVEDCPEASEFRESGLTADVVLRAGARHWHRAPVTYTDEDAVFTPARGTTSDLLTVDRPPDIEELRRHTPRFLPSKLTRGHDLLMPKFVLRHNTPRGVRRIRRLMWVLQLDELVCWGTILALVAQAIGHGPWWLLLCTFLVQRRAYMVLPPVWLIMKATAVLLVPTPLSYAVCCAALTDLLHTYAWLRLKRLDLAEPGLRFDWFARQALEAWMKGDLTQTETNR